MNILLSIVMGFLIMLVIKNTESAGIFGWTTPKPKVKKLPRKMVRFMKDNIYSDAYVYSVIKTPKGWDYCWKLRGHSGNSWSCQDYSDRSKSYCMDQYFSINYDRVKKLRGYKSQRMIIR